MQILGLDRVALLVKDIDEARGLFANKFGIELDQISAPPQIQAVGNLGMKLEIVSVDTEYPLPSFLRQGAEQLLKDDSKSMLLALVFRVPDCQRTEGELASKNIAITDRVGPTEIQIGDTKLSNFSEFFLNPDDTMGITVAFASYDEA